MLCIVTIVRRAKSYVAIIRSMPMLYIVQLIVMTNISWICTIKQSYHFKKDLL